MNVLFLAGVAGPYGISRLSSGGFVSWLLQLCAGQAEVSLAVDTAAVGFVTVVCVRVCPPSLEQCLSPAGG